MSPGLSELTRKAPKVGMLGVNEKDFAQPIKCRFCGSDMFIVDEEEEAIVMGCAYEFCPNNPDNPMSTYFYQRAKKRLGRIMEDQF